MKEFKFNLGDIVQDVVTNFQGVVVYRSQWLNNCNTYGVQPIKLKNGTPQSNIPFDEPQLRFVKKIEYDFEEEKSGGPQRQIERPNT